MTRLIYLLILVFISSGVFSQSSTTTPPSIILASALSEVRSNSPIYLAAVANDDEGIARIVFYREQLVVGEVTAPPYTFKLTFTEADNGPVPIRAIAYDLSGNKTISNTVILNVAIGGSAPAATTPTDTAPSTTPAETVTEPVTAQAEPLRARNDGYETLVNTPFELGMTAGSRAAVRIAGSVLDNDRGASAISTISDEQHGSVTIQEDGTFSFIPEAGFVGLAGFRYSISNGTESSEASVTIRVLEANADAPGEQGIWYVDSNASAGDGSALQPVSLTEAENLSKNGDIIFLFAGSYRCAESCFSLKPQQQLVGEAVGLSLQNLEIVARGSAAILQDAASTAIWLADGASVKGLTIKNAGREVQGSSGIRGNDVMSGAIFMEDLTIENPSGFGIMLDESNASDASTGTRHTLTIRRVAIRKPGQIGIVSNDAISVLIEDCSINDIALNPNDGFSGRGIQVESEFNTNVTLRNNTVSSQSKGSESQALIGYFILKNNAFGNAANRSRLQLRLENNQANLSSLEADNTLGYQVIVFAGSGNFPADQGELLLAGVGNRAMASRIVDFSGGSATISGTFEVGGSSYPQVPEASQP